MAVVTKPAEEEDLLVYGSSCFSLDQESSGGQEHSTTSYRFPAGVDLGTSYGSYLQASQCGRQSFIASNRSPARSKQASSVPKLPPLAVGKDVVVLRPVSEVQDDTSISSGSFTWSRGGGLTRATGKTLKASSASHPSLRSLCNDLHLLIESLVDLKDQLSRSNMDNSALGTLCSTLLPAHRELREVVSRLTGQAGDPRVTGESLQLVMLYMQLILQALMDQSKLLKGSAKVRENIFYCGDGTVLCCSVLCE